MIEVNYNDYKRILEENMRLIPENHKLKEEVERLNSIIKEVRERLIKPSKFIERTERLKLLEILDKGE